MGKRGGCRGGDGDGKTVTRRGEELGEEGVGEGGGNYGYGVGVITVVALGVS